MIEQTILSPVLAIGGIGPMEIVLIVLVILIFFGAKRLPELARGLGKGIREFRGAVTDTTEKLKTEIDKAPADQADQNNSSSATTDGSSEKKNPPSA